MGHQGGAQPDVDAREAWLLGANCLIYENDPGPARIDVGSVDHPAWVDRGTAVQATYTQNMLVKFDGDADRLRAAAQRCRELAGKGRSDGLRAREYARAADLCDRAAQLLVDVGADRDDWSRRRLIAQCEHDSTVAFLGFVPEIRQSAHEQLIAELASIDAEPGSSTRIPESRPYQGPSYDAATGQICIAQDADGQPCHWSLSKPGAGIEHGLIVGPRSIGKSSLVRLIVFEALCSGRFTIMLADPSGRDQWPGPFRDAAYQCSDNPGDAVKLLRGAVAVVEARHSAGGYGDPNPQRPGILLAIEECQHLFVGDAEATALAERIVTDGGPVGVALVVTAPSTDPAHFGGSLALRNGLARGNAVPMGEGGLGMILELRDALGDA